MAELTLEQILAMEPGPKLNAAVAVNVMEWSTIELNGVEYWQRPREPGEHGAGFYFFTGYMVQLPTHPDFMHEYNGVLYGNYGVYSPSTDWTAMGLVVEKMIDGARMFELCWDGPRDGWSCHFTGIGFVVGRTAPEAASKAALLAVMEGECH